MIIQPNIGQLMAGNRTGKARNQFDFYKTPPEATIALCRHYRNWIPPVVLEPACGDGAMGSVLARELENHKVIQSDLIWRGVGVPFVDFTTFRAAFDVAFAVITNPPFELFPAFIRTAHEIGAAFIAMFAKMQFWNAAERLDLWYEFPPKACHPLTWRVDFTGQGNPTMDCQWLVWGRDTPFSNMPLRRPV